jgi:hypothetical protein
LHGFKKQEQQSVFTDDAAFIKKAFLWKVNDGLKTTEIVKQLAKLGFVINEKHL